MASSTSLQSTTVERKALLCAAGLLLVGVWLRVNHLLGERAFWYDELSVLANLMARGYSALSAPLDSDQVAPFGFLVILKWFGENLGFTEIGVRLPVTLASIAALGLFYLLARRVTHVTTALIGLGLFATNNWLIYYAAEAKQYTFDVAAALLIYVVGVPLLTAWSPARVLILGLVGAALVWFSHPAAFVLGAVGLVLIWQSLAAGHHQRTGILTLLGAVWLASFGFHLWFSSAIGTDVTANQQNLYWARNFMPFPPAQASDIMWYWRAIVGIFKSPLGFETAGLAAMIAATGAWNLWRRSPALLWMLVLPLAIALLASGLRLYPFTGRLLLFATPAILLLIAEGMVLMGTWAWRHAKVLWLAGLAVLMFHPLGSTARQAAATQPYLREGLPEVLAYMQENAKADDRIHLYGSAEKGFRFYSPHYGLQDMPLSVVPRPAEDWQTYVNSVRPLACKGRVWFVFAHITRRPIDHERLLLESADDLGVRLGSVSSSHESPLKDSLHGATAHLYDLNSSNCEAAASR